MERIISIVLPAIPETLLMVGVSSLIAVVVGLPLGMILYTSQKGGLSENLTVYKILDGFVNIFRSLPFAVLMLLVMPLTRFIVGRRIGTTASIVPLTITAIPFIARMFEGNFNGLDKGIIEAARAMGSDTLTILRKVVLKESLPQIISTVTMTIINLIGQSAIVGLIGEEA